MDMSFNQAELNPDYSILFNFRNEHRDEKAREQERKNGGRTRESELCSLTSVLLLFFLLRLPLLRYFPSYLWESLEQAHSKAGS